MSKFELNNLKFDLVKTTKRLTFDIEWQESRTQNRIIGNKDYKFTASNDYEIISRSRMDIQTERLWLLGSSSSSDERSGSMVFNNNGLRDIAYIEFLKALKEWDLYWVKYALRPDVIRSENISRMAFESVYHGRLVSQIGGGRQQFR